MRSLTSEGKEVLIVRNFVLSRRGTCKWKAVNREDQSGRQFTLHEEKTGQWKVSGRNSEGSQVRKRFPAIGLTEAVEHAAVLLYGCASDRTHPQLDLATAFATSIDSGGGSAEHKKHQYQFAGYFCEWCEKQGLTHWHQLRLVRVREYMNGLVSRGLKASTVGHYLEPIRSTARFMAANWPEHYQDVCATLRLPKNAGQNSVYQGDDGNPVLSFEEVIDFVRWLEDYEWGHILISGVMLQGLCGLQLREALRLRWRTDVDLKAGTITIQGHPDLGEVVKNQYRVRRIPISRMILDYLGSMERTTATVVPYDADSKAYGKLLKRAFQSWNADCDLAPKDLRNTLQSHAIEHTIEEGWNTFLVNRYVGHAPATISERHYFGDKKRRMVALFREHVSAKIDAIIESVTGAKKQLKARSGEIVNFASLQKVV